MHQETVLADDSVEVADSACFKLSPSNMKAFALGMLDLHFGAVKTVRLQNFEQIVVLTKKMNSGKDEYEIRGTEVTLSLSERTLTRLLQISTDVAFGRKFGASHADFDFYRSKGMAAFRFAIKFSQDLYEWKTDLTHRKWMRSRESGTPTRKNRSIDRRRITQSRLNPFSTSFCS